MIESIELEYKAALRELITTKGSIVAIDEDERENSPEWPQFWVSPYGWKDYNASQHALKCSFVVPVGALLEEVTYSEFAGTFAENDQVVGLNAYGGDASSDTAITCACGKLKGLTLRYEGSLSEVLQEVLGLNRTQFTL